MATTPPAGRESASEPPVDRMTYEQARDELVAVVARLEAGGETLEGSLALWERGEQLAARCQEWLDGARARLDAAREDVPEIGPAGEADAGADEAPAATAKGGSAAASSGDSAAGAEGGSDAPSVSGSADRPTPSTAEAE